MSWQHRFVVIDQNQLRHPDAIARVVNDCSQNGWRILLPDGAFLEFAKASCAFDTARRSLELLAPHQELVGSSRKLADMRRIEVRVGTPTATLVEDEATKFLRSMLEEMERGDHTTLRALAEGPVTDLMPPALDVWNDHENNRRMVCGLHDAIRPYFSTAQLATLRRSPEQAIPDWLSSIDGTRFVFHGLKAGGANDEAAWTLMSTPSVSAGFVSAIVGLAAYWLVYGGLTTAPATESSGDLNDIECVVLGAMSQSLATFDRRAATICDAVAKAFEARRSFDYRRPFA